ncbi:MAG: CehA/McbA family metallohydrolase, partial [Myxococcota bacterium]
ASVFESQAITDADGHFSAKLPPGTYTAWPTAEGRGEQVKVPWVPDELAEGRPPGTSMELTVSEGEETVIPLSVGAAGRVEISVVDAGEVPIPAKISFIHEDDGGDTPDREILGEHRPYPERGYRKVFWTSDGTASGEIRPGTYTAVASRGPAFEIDVIEGVEVPAGGEPVELSFVLAKSVDSEGFVAIDTHQHASPSTDGDLSMAERIVTNVAEGLDVHFSTDHDLLVDYRPVVEAFGLRPILMSVPSDELSTTLMGHHNPWPLQPQPDAPNFGAPVWWGLPGEEPLTLDEAFDASRALGAKVIQVNHGMSSGGQGFFRAAGYDPETGEVANPEYWTDGFNAIELFNGKRNGGRNELVPIWFSFLNRGRMITATAASDSHGRIPEPGNARTWVLTGESDVSLLDADSLADAVLDMKTVPSTGPLVRFSTEGAEMGEIVTMDPLVAFDVEVQAPSWMSLDRVSLIANGEVYRTWEAGTEGWREGVIRFATTVSVTPQEDTWYVVQVEGAEEMGHVYPEVYPWAITSPIFVDADGDGAFQPPL